MNWQDFALLGSESDRVIESKLNEWQKDFRPGDFIEPLFAKKYFVAPNGDWLVAEWGSRNLQQYQETIMNCPSPIEIIRLEAKRMSSLVALCQVLREQEPEGIRSVLKDVYQLWDMGNPSIPDDVGVLTLGHLELQNIANEIYRCFPIRVTIPGKMWTLTSAEAQTLRQRNKLAQEADHLIKQCPDIKYGWLSPIYQVWYDFLMKLLNGKIIGFCTVCHRPFAGTQPSKKTCSSECGDLLNHRKYWENKRGHKRGRPTGSKNKVRE